MAMTETVRVEVVFALPGRQVLLDVAVPQGTTAAGAVLLSGIAGQFPDVEVASLPLGIFGKRVTADRVVQDGDRVELYRPLLADPRR